MTICKRLREALFLALLTSCAIHAQTKPDINRYTQGNLPTSRLNAPGIAGLCLQTDGSGGVTLAACPSGGGPGTVTAFSAANLPPLFTTSVNKASSTPALSFALSSFGAHRFYGNNTSSTATPAALQVSTTDLGDFAATAPTTAGKIPIYDPSATNSAGGAGAYVPGDPLVQGLLPDGSTTAGNPVAIGGYDTAATPALHRGTFINGAPGGTEYGIVTRNIPSGTQPVSGTVAATQSGTWTVQPGNTANTTAWKVDGSAVTQPVSGTVTANAAQSGTWTVQPGNTANTTAWKVDGSAVTQPVSGTVTANAAQSGTWTVQPGNTANTTAWKVDGSAVTQPISVAATLNVQGAKTNNNAAPGATNVGTLPAVANAAPPSVTEGNQSALSTDLAGNLRVYSHPPNVLGCYMVNGRTSTYAGLAAASPLFSFRWGSSTALAVVMRVRVNVATTVTSTTTSGAAERELIVARSFTASDTGGTAVTLTGNNQKMRTSQATSQIATNGDMRFGTTLTAGTRTLDAAPISSVLSWLGVNFTGVDIGSGGASTSTSTTAWTGLGGMGMVPLLDAVNGQDYPLVLAQNEGFIIRIGKDSQPTGFTQQTYVNISWCEVSAY